MQASHSDQNHSENNFNRMRRKRRSKNDFQGRTHQCKYCEKTYLSDIALNNHVKTKHAHLIENISRGRGRPRKNQPYINSNQLISHKFNSFFDKDLRARRKDELFPLVESSKENFNNIYTKYKGKLFKNLDSAEDFSFIDCKKEGTCDLAFWKYIEFVHEKVNREYFDFVFKFVILFRECINGLKSTDSGVFSEHETAEQVPDMCNEFISDFMEANDYYGLDMNELIELIQHCCHWLWENQYTTSRLTLVN